MNIKVFIMLLPFLIFKNTAYSQYLDLCWPIGYDSNPRVNLNFSSGSLVIDTIHRDMPLFISNACISDSLGHANAIANGCYVSNFSGDTMSNGQALNPGSCTDDQCMLGNIIIQGNLILPNPSNSNQFVLFHETCDYANDLNPSILYTSIIDMTLDSGKGGIINKNNILINAPLCIADLAAVKHANGRDWWILIHKRFTNDVITFLLDTSGIQGPFIQSIGPVFDTVGYGNSKFSPDGMWYCSTTLNGDIHLFNFNRCNGELLNYQYFHNIDTLPTFMEFSPNSKLLYLVSYKNIYQYEVQHISTSMQHLATYDGYVNQQGFGAFFFLPQLAIDNKIYIAATNTQTIYHVINFPDSVGMACDIQQHSIQLPCLNSGTIPTLPNYHLGPISTFVCDSLALFTKELTGNDFELFPNPATEILHVQFYNLKYYLGETLKIYNTLGNCIFNEHVLPNLNLQTVNIPLLDLPRGVYYLIIENKNNFITKTFVKM